MRTFHIISVDLELRFCINGGVIAEQYVLAALVGVGFLRILAYTDLAVKNACAFSTDNSLIQFVAFAVRLFMVHQGMVINQSRTGCMKKSVKVALPLLAIHHYVVIVPHQLTAECYSCIIVIGEIPY